MIISQPKKENRGSKSHVIDQLVQQDDDQIPICPVFRPTDEEFVDFSGYLEKCVSKIKDIGIFKVIPPENWIARQSGYKKIKFNVKRPIEQNVQSTRIRGAYELILIDQMSRSLERFQTEADKYKRIIEYKTPNEVEELFWRSLKNSSPIYGADVAGSLFDEGVPWNLAELKTLLVDGLGDQKIPGVTNPYVYVGSWKTMFGWHKEDMDLYSINYLHHGAAKFWYGVDLRDNHKFEKFMKETFPENVKRCDEFIRHKTTLVQPKVLAEHGIRLVKGYHRQNEFMVSRAAAYHAGFIFGFNIAEAVNFALRDWLNLAGGVRSCRCIDDSVSINMRKLYMNLGLDPKAYLGDKQLALMEPLSSVESKPKSAPKKKQQKMEQASSFSKLFKTEKVRERRSNSQTTKIANIFMIENKNDRGRSERKVHSQPVKASEKLKTVPLGNLRPGKKLEVKKVDLGKRGRPRSMEKHVPNKRLCKASGAMSEETTPLQKTWYSRTNTKTVNVFEWIQIIDQLMPTLKIKNQRERESFRNRIEGVKEVFYDPQRNNTRAKASPTSPGAAESFQKEVISLYQSTISHQLLNQMSNKLTSSALTEKKTCQCSNCQVQFEISKSLYQVVQKAKREQLNMHKKLYTKWKLKEPLINQLIKAEKARSITCYDLDQKGKCWQKLHKEFLARNERIDELIQEMKAKKQRKSSKSKQEAGLRSSYQQAYTVSHIDNPKLYTGTEDDIIRMVTEEQKEVCLNDAVKTFAPYLGNIRIRKQASQKQTKNI